MILSDPTTDSVKRTAPWALLVLGAVSLPFLPAPTWGGTPIAAVQAPAEDPPAKAPTASGETERKPSTATTPGDQKGDPPSPATPREPIRVMQPVVREVTDYAQFVGHIVAAREVELRARASGTVIAVYCRPGQVVERDQRLFKIDPRVYKAALDQAEAELERARARKTKAQIELGATRKNADQHVVSQNEVKLVESVFLEADAVVKGAEAARDLAKLNLEFTEVKAPFAGRVSGPVLGEGNVAVADTTRLATIASTNPACVTFNVPEKISLRLNRRRSERRESKGEAPVGLPVAVTLADETDFPHRGEVDSIEIPFDTATGSARWSALIPNPDGLLLPGLSVLVRLATSAPHTVILVPERAIVADSVFVVTGQDIVQRRRVKSLHGYYDGLKPVEGLQPDDWVVIERMRDLSEGAKVRVNRVPPPAPRVPH